MDRNDNRNCKTSGLPLIPPIDDELYPLSDSEDSSSSNCNIFENQPLVMGLHEVQRDELPDNPLPEVKTRKLSKKKRPKPDQNAQDQSTGSLTSASESSMVPPGSERQDEFYDAHESYYDFPENQSSATALNALTLSTQQDNPQVKPSPEATALSDATTTAATATQETATEQSPITSAVTKPVHPSNPD